MTELEVLPFPPSPCSYAIILWEVTAGEEAHSNISTYQLMAIMSRTPTYRLAVPEACPAPLAALMQRCWDPDPQAR